jgi:pilus assembly protein CpaE
VEGRAANVVTICGARGGAGSTFIATHLAAAVAGRGEPCVLVDLDPLFGEISSALGVRDDDDEIRTIGSLDPVSKELSPDHLDDALWEHPSGFRVLHAPRAFDPPGLGRADRYAAALAALTGHGGTVILHAPRGLTDLSRLAFDLADRIMLVMSLDVMAFHCARRLLAVLEDDGSDERLGFVVNRAARAEIIPSDIARVFGRSPLAIIPEERVVASLQDRGRLLPSNGRVGRMFARLADEILETAAVA